MSAQITEQKIFDALKSVEMPGQNGDVIATKAVSNILIKEGNVGLTIEISPDDASAADALKRAVEQAVDAIEGVLSVSVILTAHKPASPSSTQAPAQPTPRDGSEAL